MNIANNKPPRPRRCKRWIVLSIIVLLLAGGGVWWFWPRPLIISYETTRLTGPLYPDGTVNYLAALDAEWSAGVTPENNAAVLLVQAFGPDSISREVRAETLRRLEVNERDLHGPYFVKWDDYHRNVVTTRPEFADEQPTWSSSTGPPAGPPDPDGNDSAATMPEPDVAPPRPTARQMFESAQQKPWARADMPLLAEWLDVNREPLELVRAASRRTCHYMPGVPTKDRPHIWSLLLPSLHTFMEAGRSLAASAMLQASQGDLDGAIDDLLAVNRLGRLVAMPRGLINQMVGLLVERMGLNCMQTLAVSGQLTAEQCRRAINELAKLPPTADIAIAVDSMERFSLLDCGQSMYAGAFSLNELRTGQHSGVDLSRVVRVDWNEILRESNRVFDGAVDAMRKGTYAERQAAIQKWDKECSDRYVGGPEGLGILQMGSTRAVGDYLIAMLTPNLSAARAAEDEGVMARRLTLIALALAGHRAERGEYPADLAELVPDWLDAIPDDTFVDCPPIYRRTDDGFLLYSVGKNMADDGGLGSEDKPKDMPRADRTADDMVVRAPAPRPAN